jgi:allantoin racemase
MPKIFVLNPNTTSEVTLRVLGRVQRQVPSSVDCVPGTAAFGAPYISTEESYAIAGHAVIDAYIKSSKDFHCLLLACFGDPGIFALREICPMPVIGLVEASLIEAKKLGSRIAIVTGT